MEHMMVVTRRPEMTKPAGFGGSLRLYQERGVETCVICLTPGQAETHRGERQQRQGTWRVAAQGIRRRPRDTESVARDRARSCPDGQLHRLDMQRVVSDLTLRMQKFHPQVLAHIAMPPARSPVTPITRWRPSLPRWLSTGRDEAIAFLTNWRDRSRLTESRSCTTPPPTSLFPDASPSLCLQSQPSSK